jgi:hypothetical protein
MALSVLSALAHQLEYSAGNKSLPSDENHGVESRFGSVPSRKSSLTVAWLNFDGNKPVAAQTERWTRFVLGRSTG